MLYNMNNSPFNYKPTSQQSGMYNNFDKAFMQNTPIINSMDYTNKKNTLHDNLGEKIFNERVVEYKAIISSADRDKKKFPSPFKMQVSFGNANVYPNLEESMTNVKYITLNSIFVPRSLAIDTSKINLTSVPPVYDILPLHSVFNEECHCHHDKSYLFYSLGIKPYLLVRIKELDDSHLMGTSPMYQRNTFMFIPDQRAGDMIIYKPKRASVIYPNSLLKNINLMTLSILDDRGNELELVNELGEKIITQNIKSGVNLNYNEYVEKYFDNKYVQHTDCNVKVLYDFTFGIIENEMNTLTNYNKT